MHRSLMLVSLLTTTLAFATPPAAESDVQKAAQTLVERGLLQPLAAKEKQRSRYSRVALSPWERRVRVLDAGPQTDRDGATFMAFAVDARRGLADSTWREDALGGCVYLESGRVFVSRKATHLPAEALLGKRTPPAAAHVCQAATAQVASAKRQ
jgi:hypothetical protein